MKRYCENCKATLMTQTANRLFPIFYHLDGAPNVFIALDTVKLFPCYVFPLDIDIFSDVATPGGLLHPLLLPKIYPPLFTLYALYNEKEDSNYWKRVNHRNKQTDMGLMSSLGVDQYVQLATSVCFRNLS